MKRVTAVLATIALGAMLATGTATASMAHGGGGGGGGHGGGGFGGGHMGGFGGGHFGGFGGSHFGGAGFDGRGFHGHGFRGRGGLGRWLGLWRRLLRLPPRYWNLPILLVIHHRHFESGAHSTRGDRIRRRKVWRIRLPNSDLTGISDRGDVGCVLSGQIPEAEIL